MAEDAPPSKWAQEGAAREVALLEAPCKNGAPTVEAAAAAGTEGPDRPDAAAKHAPEEQSADVDTAHAVSLPSSGTGGKPSPLASEDAAPNWSQESAAREAALTEAQRRDPAYGAEAAAAAEPKGPDRPDDRTEHAPEGQSEGVDTTHAVSPPGSDTWGQPSPPTTKAAAPSKWGLESAAREAALLQAQHRDRARAAEAAAAGKQGPVMEGPATILLENASSFLAAGGQDWSMVNPRGRIQAARVIVCLQLSAPASADAGSTCRVAIRLKAPDGENDLMSCAMFGASHVPLWFQIRN